MKKLYDLFNLFRPNASEMFRKMGDSYQSLLDDKDSLLKDVSEQAFALLERNRELEETIFNLGETCRQAAKDLHEISECGVKSANGTAAKMARLAKNAHLNIVKDF